MRITSRHALLASLAVHGCVVALAAHWLPQPAEKTGPACELCVALQIPEPTRSLIAEEPPAEPAEEALSQPPEPSSETRSLAINAPPIPVQTQTLPPPIATRIPVSVPTTVTSPARANRPQRAKATDRSAGTISGAATTPPRLLRKVRAAYPEIARNSGWEGAVQLTISVDAQGRVARVRVQRSSGHDALDAAAVAAARSYEFSPALTDGRPIEWTFEHRIVFTRN